MAYQPKSYRKFLASSVSAAMVATTFGAVVPADVQQADAAESFSDVSNDHWASESIQRLADEGIINGYQDGTYGPTEDISRGQVAELLVNAFDLEVNQDAESSFDDLNDDSYTTPFAEAVADAGFIEGRANNTEFAASRDLTRAQMATILVRAFELEPVEDSDAEVNDLEDAHESHQENIQILAQHEITQTEDGNFRPKESVNRAQFATFLDRALEVQEPLAISNVSTLTGDGHVLSVEFTRPYREELNASDVRIAESDSGERKGVESVRLASDGLSAEVTLYDDTSDNAPDEIPEGVQHDIQVGDLETTFTRDQFLNDDDNATVTEVNDDDREITVTYNEDNGDGDETTVTLDIPEDSDFNFQQALGHEISVWYDGDNNLTNYELIQHEDTLNTAIEVTENNEIETVEGGDAHDLADDVIFTVNDGSDDEIVAEGTDEVEEEGLVDEEYDYAKVVFNDSGDVQRVYAYNFNEDPILTESVDGSIVVGKDENELDLEDYRVVKDGQQISVDDIQEGDVVFFNDDAYDGDGFAVIGTNTENGEIDSIFENSFDVDGTNYNYNNDFGDVQYLDEDGEFSDLGEDEAEALQDEGPVTLYKNFKGDLVYVTGEVDGIEQTYDASYLQDSLSAYISSTGDTMIELEGINAEGNSYLYDFAPDSLDEITVQNDGETVYETDESFPTDSEDETGEEIDEFALAIDDGDGNLTKIDDSGLSSGPIANQIGEGETIQFVALNNSGGIIDSVISLTDYVSAISEDEDYTKNIVSVGEDSNDNVQDLEFFEGESAELLDSEIDEDDDYANGSLLQDDTLVYDVSDANGDFKDPDEDDVSVTTWGDLKENGVNISANQAAVYSDEDNYVSHLVTYQDVISSGDEHTALIKNYQTSDGDVVRAEVLVNGEERAYDVNDVDPGSIEEGDLVEIEVNDADDLITDLINLNDDNRLVSGTVVEDGVSVSNDEVTVDVDGTERTFELVNDGQVYDGSDSDPEDHSIENLRDIEEGDNLTIAVPSEGSNFADAFVIEEDSSDSDEDTVESDATLYNDLDTENLPSTVTFEDDNGDRVTYELSDEVIIEDESGEEISSGVIPADEGVNYDLISGTETVSYIQAVNFDSTDDSDENLTVSVDDSEATAGDSEVDVTYSVSNVEEAVEADFEITDSEGDAVGSTTADVEEDVSDETVTISVNDEAELTEGDYTVTATIGEETVEADLTVEAQGQITEAIAETGDGNIIGAESTEESNKFTVDLTGEDLDTEIASVTLTTENIKELKDISLPNGSIDINYNESITVENGEATLTISDLLEDTSYSNNTVQGLVNAFGSGETVTIEGTVVANDDSEKSVTVELELPEESAE